MSPRLARLPIGDAVHDRQPVGWPAAQRGRPNVLYIVWDDATIAAWDAFGGLIGTPNMDWLARRGLRYSQWHTGVRARPVDRGFTAQQRKIRPGVMSCAWQAGSRR